MSDGQMFRAITLSLVSKSVYPHLTVAEDLKSFDKVERLYWCCSPRYHVHSLGNSKILEDL